MPDTESLAAVPAGVDIEIVQGVRVRAPFVDADARLSPGARFRCRQNGAASILLTSDEGETVSVRSDDARFVRVRRRDPEFDDIPGRETR